MEAYTSFSQVYDLFMADVPYREWCDYIEARLGEYGITDGILLDLGCGTGKMTRLMADKGFDLIGIDLSAEMLEIAREANGESCVEGRSAILYLLQDMREFELYGTVRAVYCACDSMNYILEEEELLEVFSLVNNYLDPKGIFIFDFNTEYKYRMLLAENTFAENRDEGSFIWENYYDEESGINEYDLTLFIREQGEEGDRFQRFQEVHYQRSYGLDQIKELIEKSGMKLLEVYDGYTTDKVRPDSDRITVIAQENGK